MSHFVLCIPVEKYRRARTALAALFLLSIAVMFAATARAGDRITLDRPRGGDLLEAGFSLPRAQMVAVEAVGLIRRFSDEYTIDAWILDSGTRRTVWAMSDKRRRDVHNESRYLRHADEEIELQAGDYTLYLYAGEHWNVGMPFNDRSSILRDLADMLAGEKVSRKLGKYRNKSYVTVEFSRPREVVRQAPGERSGALIQMTNLRDSSLVGSRIRVVRPTSVRLYGIGEAYFASDVLADYSWIENTETGKVIWRMDKWNTGPAGGAGKNRLVDEVLDLKPGDFVLRSFTDDSHAPGSWNTTPPRDPRGWGVTMLPAEGYRDGDVVVLDIDAGADRDCLVDLRLVGNGEHRCGDFVLATDSKVDILAVGEGDRDEMFDFGWIEEVDSGRKVWVMTWPRTRRAGGAKKNRIFADEISLPAGSYEAHYLSDNSHSFGAWNADPPRDPENWGMRIRLIR